MSLDWGPATSVHHIYPAMFADALGSCSPVGHLNTQKTSVSPTSPYTTCVMPRDLFAGLLILSAIPAPIPAMARVT